MNDSEFLEAIGVKPMTMADLVCHVKDSEFGEYYVEQLIKRVNKYIRKHLGGECEVKTYDVDYNDDVDFTMEQLVHFVDRLYEDFDLEIVGGCRYAERATIKISPARKG